MTDTNSPRARVIPFAFLAILSGQLVARLSPDSEGLHAAETKRPNVIFILTDDQGWADAKFAGHPYVQTPNLDRLASQGTWFKQFYVAATVCSPSRCAFMTSHYPARHQIHGHFADHALNQARSMPDWLDPQTVTVTKLLHDAGYATGHFGKWHLGGGDGAPTPDAYGIDDVRAMVCRDPAWTEPATTFWAKSSTAIVDEAIRFIKANKDRPFYANVWTLLPHAPLNPTPEQLKVYESLAPHADDPAFGRWMQQVPRRGEGFEEPDAGLLRVVDRSRRADRPAAADARRTGPGRQYDRVLLQRQWRRRLPNRQRRQCRCRQYRPAAGSQTQHVRRRHPYVRPGALAGPCGRRARGRDERHRRRRLAADDLQAD